MNRRSMMAFALASLVVFPLRSNAADPAPKKPEAKMPVEIIAHRGASFDAPENTLAAIKLAWEQGADVAENDVHLSKDGVPVIMHDADTKRVAGVDKKVADQTLAELQALDVGRWKGEKFAGAKIPTLAEWMAATAPGKRLFIEIKGNATIVPPIMRVIKESTLKPEQIRIISFSIDAVAAAKKARPDIEVYWLYGFPTAKAKDKEPLTAEQLIAKAKGAKADGLDLSASPLLDAAFAAKVKAAGLKFYVWTVDDAATAKRMVEIGVDGITTNKPGWLREKLK